MKSMLILQIYRNDRDRNNVYNGINRHLPNIFKRIISEILTHGKYKINMNKSYPYICIA